MRRLLFVLGLAACGSPVTSLDADATSDASMDVAPESDVANTDAPNDGDVDAATGTFLTTLAAGVPANVNAVAFQDGDGPWTLLDGANGRYDFSVTGARYGLAIACDATGHFIALRATIAERPRPVIACGASASDPTLSGSIRGVTNLYQGTEQISFAGASTSVMPAGSAPSYSFAVPNGIYDLLASDIFLSNVPHVIVMRNVSVSADTTLDLDFGTQGLALSPGSHSIALGGTAPGDTYFGMIGFQTRATPATHWTGFLDVMASGTTLATGSNALQHYPEVPSAPGDLYSALAVASAMAPTPNAMSAFRTAERYFATPADLSLELPAPYVTPTVATVLGPALAVRATLPSYAGATAYTLDWNTGGLRWSGEITVGALGTDSGYTVPDPQLALAPFTMGVSGSGPPLCVVAVRTGDDANAAPQDGTQRGRAGVELSAR